MPPAQQLSATANAPCCLHCLTPDCPALPALPCLTNPPCRYDTPLVADIHFQPAVAMMVADAFEKIRINPGARRGGAVQCGRSAGWLSAVLALQWAALRCPDLLWLAGPSLLVLTLSA